ncbi:MAG: hypothetical protein HRU20_18920 [Pseudomonadales bacterium]|nr:hypothetical protein [Pseudomonadales bacterium]
MMNKYTKLCLTTTLSLSLFGTSIAEADPLSLANDPLVLAAVVNPNLMILMDTSGSMFHIVPDYDASQTYGADCTGGFKLSSTTTFYRLHVSSNNGFAYIKTGNSYYFWGTSDSGGSNDDRCFDPALKYTNVTLGIDFYNTYGSSYATSYSGNYLNWYFSNDNQDGKAYFGHGAKQRPGQLTRIDSGRASLETLVADLTDVNVGIAGFGSGKASIRTGLRDINVPNNKTLIDNAIATLEADTQVGTPLASAATAIGRYFSSGYNATGAQINDPLGLSTPSTQITLADDDTLHADVFNISPSYYSGNSAPSTSVITQSCQRNFLLTFTDGEPSAEGSYSNNVAKWVDGTINKEDEVVGDFDDAIGALNDIDFRPDFDEDLNNIISYVIGFTVDFPMLSRAASLGGGVYSTAGNTAELDTAINTAIQDFKSQTGSIGIITFNSAQLETGSALYSATFNTGNWSGDIQSYALSDTGDIATTSSWSAGTNLESLAASDRNIFSYNDATNTGIAFTYAELSGANTGSSLAADLALGADVTGSGSGSDVANIQAMINFIRGDVTYEGSSATNYRDRSQRLSDIVNSSPVFVGEPVDIWSDDGYSTFVDDNATRDEVIYVGSNDGMLHGFNANLTGTGNGDEIFSYIPNAIASTVTNRGLHNLASQDFVHRPYVDATPTVRDAFINTQNGDGDSWHTLLLGNLGAGGRGIFALDITDPADFKTPANASNIVLWEFSSADDDNLGFTFADPLIVKLNNGKWGAIFGNGYNNTGDGHAELFIVFLEEGLDGTWDHNEKPDQDDYVRLDTEVGSTTTPNGLSTATVVDIDKDNIVDRVYVGDLQGNMWVFDISDKKASNWGSAYSTGSAPEPLFTGLISGQPGQPITSAPSVTIHPDIATDVSKTGTNNEPNILVLFGTGQYLQTSDISNTDTQSYYAVWDSGRSGLTRSDLVPRQITESVINSVLLRKTSGAEVEYVTTDGSTPDFGWYLDLFSDSNPGDNTVAAIAEGERVLKRGLLRGDVIFFPTQIPTNVACENGGDSWLMAMEIATGLAPEKDAAFDANGDGVINADDLGYVGVHQDELIFGTNILGSKEYFMQGEVPQSREVHVRAGVQEGRLSWYEFTRD